MDADALPKAEDEGEEEGEDDGFGEGNFVGAGQECTDGAAANGGNEPGKAKAERAQWRGVADLIDVEAEGFEGIVAGLFIRQFKDFFGEETDIDDAEDFVVGMRRRGRRGICGARRLRRLP